MGKLGRLFKRTTAMLMIVVLLIGIALIGELADMNWSGFAFTVSADYGFDYDFISDGYYCEILEDETVSIAKYSEGEGVCTVTTLNIPSEIQGRTVTEIGYRAFVTCEDLTTVTFPDTIRRVFCSAFYDTAFFNDRSNWENGALYVGNCLIYVESDCTSYEVRKGTKVIACAAFEEGGPFTASKNLKSIIIPDSIKRIDRGSISYCKKLENIQIPKSVTSVNNFAFCDSNSLSNIYYTGSEEEWKNIEIGWGNESLDKAKIHYNYNPHTHSYTAKTTKSATCTTAGTTTYTCSCGDSYTKPIKATGHKETTLKAVSPTYTKTGLTVGKKCSVCGKVTVAQKTVAKLTLGKVSGFNASSIKTTSLKLTWNKVTGAEKYEIQQYKNGSWKTIKTTTATSYTVKKLKSGTTYKFRVRAVVDGATGTFAELSTKTKLSTPKLTLKARTKQLTASWKSITGASGYEVQYSTSKSMKNAKTVKVKKSTKKTTIKKLKKGKKYYVRVRAYTTVNGKKVYSNWSTVKNVKVK